MDLINLTALKSLLYKHDIRPNKRLGQNFLIDKGALQKLIETAKISKDDTIVEVGAGIGTITVELAKLAKKVIAVEKDRALLAILKETTGDFKNIEIVAGDILKIDCLASPDLAKRGKLVGNIPYYLTAPLIRKFLESENPPKQMVLMVQKEMAERICAKPPNMSILAVSVQVYARPEIVSYVPRSSFWPAPAVDSAILKVVPHSQRSLPAGRQGGFNAENFFRIVRAGFSSPRKQLTNNLPKKLLQSAGIDPTRRAETLSLEEWARLSLIPIP